MTGHKKTRPSGTAGSIGGILLVATSLLILWFPSILLLLTSLHSDNRPLLQIEHVTIIEFQRALSDLAIRDELMRSGQISLATALLCSIVGWFLGYNLRRGGVADQIAVTVAFIPLVLPPQALAWSLDYAFERVGIPRGPGALVLAHTLMFLPISLLFNWLRASQLGDIPDVAGNLGAASWRVIRCLLWPHQRPTLYVCLLVVGALSMTEATVGYYVTSSEKPFAVANIQSLSGSFDATRYAAAVLLFVVTTLALGGGLAAQWSLSAVEREDGAGH